MPEYSIILREILVDIPSGAPDFLTDLVFALGPLERQEREVELGKRRKLFSVYEVHEEIGRSASS